MTKKNTTLHRDLPSTTRLIASTIVAALVAALLLVTTILPAEYGIDPTGVGNLLGLTEMGKIKTQLANEASVAAQEKEPSDSRPLVIASSKPEPTKPKPMKTQAVSEAWRDITMVTLSPGQGVEYKLVMNKGDKAIFEWSANGGKLNYDTHGDGGGQFVSYQKGRGVPEDSGVLQAQFKGYHGWFWRNRTKENVTLILKTKGEYLAIKRAA